MKSLREDRSCGFSISNGAGYRKALAVNKKALPFELPEAGSGEGRRQYRYVSTSLRLKGRNDTLRVECWVPSDLPADQLIVALEAAKLTPILKRLDAQKRRPDSLFREPISREYQQLKYELLDEHPGPMPLTKSSSGGATRSYTTEHCIGVVSGYTAFVECEYCVYFDQPDASGNTSMCNIQAERADAVYSVSWSGSSSSSWFIDNSWACPDCGGGDPGDEEDPFVLELSISPSEIEVETGSAAFFAASTNGVIQHWRFTPTGGSAYYLCPNSSVCAPPATSSGTMEVLALPPGVYSGGQWASATLRAMVSSCSGNLGADVDSSYPTQSYDTSALRSYIVPHRKIQNQVSAVQWSTGDCALYLRNALCFAGITAVCNGSAHAKYWGTLLPRLGFTECQSFEPSHPSNGSPSNDYPSGYTPRTGDIVVFTDGTWGHVATYIANSGVPGYYWFSDRAHATVQRYNGDDKKYTIYRWGSC